MDYKVIFESQPKYHHGKNLGDAGWVERDCKIYKLESPIHPIEKGELVFGDTVRSFNPWPICDSGWEDLAKKVAGIIKEEKKTG